MQSLYHIGRMNNNKKTSRRRPLYPDVTLFAECRCLWSQFQILSIVHAANNYRYRTSLSRLSCACKTHFGIPETDVAAFFTISGTNSFARGHNFKLLMSQPRLDVRKYFFAHRMVLCWTVCLLKRVTYLVLQHSMQRLLQRTDMAYSYTEYTEFL